MNPVNLHDKECHKYSCIDRLLEMRFPNDQVPAEAVDDLTNGIIRVQCPTGVILSGYFRYNHHVSTATRAIWITKCNNKLLTNFMSTKNTNCKNTLWSVWTWNCSVARSGKEYRGQYFSWFSINAKCMKHYVTITLIQPQNTRPEKQNPWNITCKSAYVMLAITSVHHLSKRIVCFFRQVHPSCFRLRDSSFICAICFHRTVSLRIFLVSSFALTIWYTHTPLTWAAPAYYLRARIRGWIPSW